MSDHFTTLRSKGLNHVSSTGFDEYDLTAYIGQAIWGMYPHLAGDQSFWCFWVPINLNFRNFDGCQANQVTIVLHRAWNRGRWRKFLPLGWGISFLYNSRSCCVTAMKLYNMLIDIM